MGSGPFEQAGISKARLFRYYLRQLGWLWLAATVCGLLLGWVAQFGLQWVLDEWFGKSLPQVIGPRPFLNAAVPATSEPRRPPGGRNPFQQQQPPPEPKGNVGDLWALLGVDFTDRTVVWDDYNPYPKIQEFYPEFAD